MFDQAISTIKQIWRNQKLRNKLLFTAGIFLLFRLLAHIPVPAVDTNQLQSIFAGSQFLSFAVILLAVIGLVVFMNQAVRKIPIQYAKRVRGSRVYGGQRTHLPVRVNVAGVMPIIFAVSLMLVP
ncbi:MAG: preprotein translocase subunit SecY, partial [Candidatus Pacebacteria bacterium]|nr:preprotein translocase subunit SecY [Candidatus Paceibacterota bacterium]